jgi:hypothetical protein
MKASKKEAAETRRWHRLAVDSDSDESDRDPQSDPDYAAGRRYNVPNFHHRKLLDIIVETCSGPAAKEFHWHAFEEHWTLPWNPQLKKRVYSDLPSSKASAMIQQARSWHSCWHTVGANCSTNAGRLFFDDEFLQA